MELDEIGILLVPFVLHSKMTVEVINTMLSEIGEDVQLPWRELLIELLVIYVLDYQSSRAMKQLWFVRFNLVNVGVGTSDFPLILFKLLQVVVEQLLVACESLLVQILKHLLPQRQRSL